MKIRLNRRQRVVASTVVLLVASITVMTLAFFSSTDTVTNKVTSREPPKILLSEPQWYEKGKSLAENYVPDITIPKDPYVTNLSEYDVYVRMKLDIFDAGGNAITNPDRFNAILKSIHLNADGSGDALLNFNDDGTILSSNNDKFFYNSDDGYFYYGTKDTNGKVTLIALASTKKTPKLFESVVVPNNKDVVTVTGDDNTTTQEFAYNLYFSTQFSIKVSAEAVYVIENSNETFKETVERFNKA